MKLISPVCELQEDTVNFSRACSTLYGRGDRELKARQKKRKDAGTETKETKEQSKVTGNTS